MNLLRLLPLFLFIISAMAVRAESLLPGVVVQTLPSGLKLIVRQVKTSPLVAIDIWIRAGSGAEGQKESGAAHFLEHLLFKGTSRRKAGEIDAAIENMGGLLNAGTLRDGAHFYTTLHNRHLDDAFEVMADAVQNPALRPEDIELERMVILDEMARSRNDTRKDALNLLYAQLFQDIPQGRPILGEIDSLRALTRDTIASFHHRLYRPSNMVVVLVGDVTPEHAHALATKHFLSSDPPKALLESPKELGCGASCSFAVDQSSGGMLYGFGYRGPGGTESRQLATAMVMTALLGDQRTGLLGIALSKEQAATRIEAEFTPLRPTGAITFLIRTTEKSLPVLKRIIRDRVEKLKDERILENELDMARRRVLSSVLYDVETVGGQARLLGLYQMSAEPDLIADFRSLVQKVSAADLIKFAKTWLIADNLVEAVVPL